MSVLNDDQKRKTYIVTAITPTPAGEGKTTTTLVLHPGVKIGKRSLLLYVDRLWARFGVKGGQPAADMHK